MQKLSGSSGGSGSTRSTFNMESFLDPECPVPRPIHWRGHTYITNGKIAIRVPGKHAEDGEHHSISSSMYLWNRDSIVRWTDVPPKCITDRWFDDSVIKSVMSLDNVQFCDPDGGRKPARFRFKYGHGLVWPVVIKRK